MGSVGGGAGSSRGGVRSVMGRRVGRVRRGCVSFEGVKGRLEGGKDPTVSVLAVVLPYDATNALLGWR